MAFVSHRQPAHRLRQGGVLAALTASLLLGACGQTLKSGSELLSLSDPDNKAPSTTQAMGSSKAGHPAVAGGISDDLLKATDYWGQVYAKSPRDLPAALNYARNLKAMGEKRRALAVLQQAAIYHGQDRELASEYGRLALDLDQITVAKQLLAIADDPARPDWRVISARGAALAKEGNYNEAIPYFERARELSNGQASVLSNLALAYAMNGEPAKAESMLRQASVEDSQSPRIRQNLALVLGLQGKYDEAKLIAARDMPMNNAAENADYLRQVVKLEPKSMPGSDSQSWDTNSQVAELPVARAVPVEKVAQVSSMPPIEAAAAKDEGWVVSGSAPLEAAKTGSDARQGKVAPASQKVLSVSEMAAQFAVADEEGGAEAKDGKAPQRYIDQSGAWASQVAQVKR